MTTGAMKTSFELREVNAAGVSNNEHEGSRDCDVFDARSRRPRPSASATIRAAISLWCGPRARGPSRVRPASTREADADRASSGEPDRSRVGALLGARAGRRKRAPTRCCVHPHRPDRERAVVVRFNEREANAAGAGSGGRGRATALSSIALVQNSRARTGEMETSRVA
jgi:Arc/MetJ-type ribon-helix-helix transcriptional regulator